MSSQVRRSCQVSRTGMVAGAMVLILLATAGAQAAIIMDLTGDIWDINLATGLASNKRPAASTGCYVIDIVKAGSSYYTMTTSASTGSPNTLAIVDPATAQLTYVGTSGVGGMIEGDMAFDASANVFYVTYQIPSGTARNLLKVDMGGTATVVGALPADTDYSGLSFDGIGNLYLLDNWNKKLLRISKTDASVLGTVNVTSGGTSLSMGDTAGLDYDAVSGKMYLLTGASPSLYTLNPGTGEANLVGSTGLPLFTDVAGISTAVPEPASLTLLALGGLAMIRRRRRAGTGVG